MNKDQIKGKLLDLKGRAEALVGAVTGDPVTQLAGEIDRANGAAQEKVGDVKEKKGPATTTGPAASVGRGRRSRR